MEEFSHADILAKHLNALHAARKAFMEAESSDKLRRALKAKNRETAAIEYEIGDMVYYIRKSSDKWKGPGTVIGKENTQILVKHGGYYIRVHPCSLQLISNNVYILETFRKDKNTDDEKLVEKDCSIISDDEREFYLSSKECDTESLLVNENDMNTLTDSLNDLTISASVNSDISNPNVINNILPKVRSTVLYHNPDHNSWNKVLILSRTRKAKGKNNSWFNVKYITQDEHISIDFSEIKGWNIEEEVLIAIPSDNNVEILEAKQAKLNSWVKHNVYEEVEDRGQKVALVRWEISQKFKDNKMKYKARLVTCGIGEDNLSNIRKNSPTCCKDDFRLTLSIIISNKWIIHSADVKSTFLQVQGIDPDIYLKPPKEASTKKLWKLKTTVYGLCDAPRVWFISVKQVLLKAGAEKSKLDDSIFFWHRNGKVQGLICCHVDDFFGGGINNFEKTVIQKLKERFVTSAEELESFKCLGLNIAQKK